MGPVQSWSASSPTRPRSGRDQRLRQSMSSCSAASENAHMLSTRSLRCVSSVMDRCTGPSTAMQLWPAASPYGLPVGPVAPVSAIPQVVASLRANGLRAEPRVRFGGGANAAELFAWNVEQGALRDGRIDDAAADEVGRCAGYRDQRGADQSGRGRLGDGDRFAARLEQFGGAFSQRKQPLHENSCCRNAHHDTARHAPGAAQPLWFGAAVRYAILDGPGRWKRS